MGMKKTVPKYVDDDDPDWPTFDTADLMGAHWSVSTSIRRGHKCPCGEDAVFMYVAQCHTPTHYDAFGFYRCESHKRDMYEWLDMKRPEGA